MRTDNWHLKFCLKIFGLRGKFLENARGRKLFLTHTFFPFPRIPPTFSNENEPMKLYATTE